LRAYALQETIMPNHEVIVVIYDAPERADEAALALRDPGQGRGVAIHSMAIARRDDAGALHINEPRDASFGAGALTGGLAAGIAAAFFSAPLVIPAALGAGLISGLVARLRDSGIDDTFIAAVGDALAPGTSALFLLADGETGTLREALAATGGQVLGASLGQADVEALGRMLGDASAE
jgi:uncharacterized membrane protein